MSEIYRESYPADANVPERTWVVEAKGLKYSIKMYARPGDRFEGENVLCICTATAEQINRCKQDLEILLDRDRDSRETRLRKKCLTDAKQVLDSMFADK